MTESYNCWKQAFQSEENSSEESSEEEEEQLTSGTVSDRGRACEAGAGRCGRRNGPGQAAPVVWTASLVGGTVAAINSDHVLFAVCQTLCCVLCIKIGL